MQAFFFLSDLMVKCVKDCCHLEVARSVKSLQPFIVFTKCTIRNRATVICNSLKINAETAKVSSVMVLWHNAYYAKKCIPVRLYRLLCLKARHGGMNCRAAPVSEPICLLIVVQCDICWARHIYRCFHSAKCPFYIRACYHKHWKIPVTNWKEQTDHLLCWWYI